MKWGYLVLFTFIVMGCSSAPIISHSPKVNSTHSLMCGNGLSEEALRVLEKKIVNSKDGFGDEFNGVAKSIIIEDLISEGMSKNKVKSSIHSIYEEYTACLKENNLPFVIQVQHERWASASCRRICCTKNECDDGCVMTEVEGLIIPRDEGSAKACPTRNPWYKLPGIDENKKESGTTYSLTLKDNIITYDNLRGCIESCPSLEY